MKDVPDEEKGCLKRVLGLGEGRLECSGDDTFQIRAGAKSPAFTRYDTHAQRRLLVEPFPDGVEFDVTGGVDAIEGLGPREGDEEEVGGWKGDFGEGGWREGGGEAGGGHVGVGCYRGRL